MSGLAMNRYYINPMDSCSLSKQVPIHISEIVSSI